MIFYQDNRVLLVDKLVQHCRKRENPAIPCMMVSPIVWMSDPMNMLNSAQSYCKRRCPHLGEASSVGNASNKASRLVDRIWFIKRNFNFAEGLFNAHF